MDTVTFGVNENTKPIEWIVLEKQREKALLLSKRISIRHSFNYKNDKVTWENSTIREYLNIEYINIIFNKEEQTLILTTDVLNDNNAKFGSTGGNNMKDKIFLLSINELNKYFNSDNQRATSYIRDGGIPWLLRTPGANRTVGKSGDVSIVDEYGRLDEYGLAVDDDYGVRPALWIKY